MAHVRALTQNAASKPAQALATSGAEVVQGDMGEPASLRPIFAEAYGVYSVQNTFISGPEAEVRQGKIVAEVAKDSGVQHLVYGSAGIGRKGSGIPSWETKLLILSGSDGHATAAVPDATLAVHALWVGGSGFDDDVALAANGRH